MCVVVCLEIYRYCMCGTARTQNVGLPGGKDGVLLLFGVRGRGAPSGGAAASVGSPPHVLPQARCFIFLPTKRQPSIVSRLTCIIVVPGGLLFADTPNPPSYLVLASSVSNAKRKYVVNVHPPTRDVHRHKHGAASGLRRATLLFLYSCFLAAAAAASYQ